MIFSVNILFTLTMGLTELQCKLLLYIDQDDKITQILGQKIRFFFATLYFKLDFYKRQHAASTVSNLFILIKV